MRSWMIITLGFLFFCSVSWAGRSIIDEARELEKKEMYKEAEVLLKNALSQNPRKRERFDILLELADLDFQCLSRPSQALAYLLEVKTLYPDRFPKMDRVYYRLGLVYENLGQYVEAAKAFERVATKYRKSPFFDDALEGVERAFKKNFQDWVAIVSGTPITKLELDDRIQDFPPFLRARYESPEGRKELLERMIDELVLYREAEAKKIYLDADVAKNLRRSRMQILERAIYKKEVSEKVKVSDSEISRYYRNHRDEFKVPAKVSLRRIVVRSEEEARNILEEAKKGIAFDSLAMQYSITPEAKKGGLLENLTKKSRPEELVEVAFSLKEGQISDVITLPDSTFAIIRVEKKSPAGYRPLEEVRERISGKLRQQKESEMWEKYRETLRKKYEVKYAEEFKKSMEEELGKKLPEKGTPSESME